MVDVNEPIRGPRLSIAYLMIITTGVCAALAISQGIARLRWPADRWFYGLSEPTHTAFGMAVAAMYGLCVTMFLCALRAGRIWDSPGKVLALLFATMCVCEWSLEAVSGAIVSSRVAEWPGTITDAAPNSPGLAAGVGAGHVAGIWYRTFAPKVGYVLGLPLLALVLFKTRHHSLAWRWTWGAFLLFDLALVFELWASVAAKLQAGLRPYYFDLAIGLPMALMLIALVDTCSRRRTLDWWTGLVAVPLAAFWLATLVLKLTKLA